MLKTKNFEGNIVSQCYNFHQEFSFSSSDDPERQPWCQLFSSMLTKVPSAECANTVYKLTKGMPANHALSEKVKNKNKE